mmetsp:Transcript_20690/g.30611  ORF Transcript_20690/g.30611 Transcript_20690/m.30611 type:complete len:133 (-) Transcript_20690:37-435(-)
MAYAQWVIIAIKPLGFILTIKNCRKQCGKFYKGDKDIEIPTSEIERHEVCPGEKFQISACGRAHAPEGTEGAFDLYHGEKYIGNYFWSCPWGSKTNKSVMTKGSEEYLVEVTGANIDSGALGNVCIKVVNIG